MVAGAGCQRYLPPLDNLITAYDIAAKPLKTNKHNSALGQIGSGLYQHNTPPAMGGIENE
ncbi:MAG: hypothetical protein JKY88_07745 [Pseudomonadales bacterium]|nr:hypothetical protein [Pseudomonadales bacterium]